MASWLARALDVLRPHPGDTIMPGARVFPALGGQVLSGQVYAMDGTRLGALAGARAVAGDGNSAQEIRHRRITTTHDGVAVVAFADGRTHQVRRIGAQFLTAQREALAFTTMAQAAG